MLQRDYLLKEIERIGLLLRALTQKLFGGSEPLAIAIENPSEEAKNRLLHELQFSMDHFLILPDAESISYLVQREGFNMENIELLANMLGNMATLRESLDSNLLAAKSLLLYHYINQQSKTYSIEREANIEILKQLLSKE